MNNDKRTKEIIEQAYELGFDFELNSNKYGLLAFECAVSAFNLGRKDAIAGDDCEAVDLIPTFEKVDMIFEKYFGK